MADRPDQDQGLELIVERASAFLPVSGELLAEGEETRREVEAWMAMSPEERAAHTAKRDAEQMVASDGGSFGRFSGKVCGTCSWTDEDGYTEGDPYPCVTLRVLAKAYGWSP